MPGRHHVSPIPYHVDDPYPFPEVMQNPVKVQYIAGRFFTPSIAMIRDGVRDEVLINPVNFERSLLHRIQMLAWRHGTCFVVDGVNMRMTGQDREQQRCPRAPTASNNYGFAAETHHTKWKRE